VGDSVTVLRLDPSKAFLGIGWAFPVSSDPSSCGVELAAYEEDIRQSVLLILQTDQGERVMRPDFGSGLRALVFEPLNTTTMALVKHRVEQALIAWEPRIDVQEVSVSTDPETRNRLNVEIRYRVRTVNTFYNLVFPFYLQEGRP
jgi:Bacteriophage baseplate protein W